MNTPSLEPEQKDTHLEDHVAGGEDIRVRRRELHNDSRGLALPAGALVMVGVIVLLILIVVFPYVMKAIVAQTLDQALSPVNESSQQLKTQIANLLNPTPTIIPDPMTIVHKIEPLARLETVQYSVEKIITAEIAQGKLDFLFGDRLLLVAHGRVSAGIDLARAVDARIEGKTVYLRLPEAEIFDAYLDNGKSYVYDRETGLLTKGDKNLETSARRVAEEEIRKAALEDGILKLAQQNAENYLSRLLHSMGYMDVLFEYYPIPSSTENASQSTQQP